MVPSQNLSQTSSEASSNENAAGKRPHRSVAGVGEPGVPGA
ncbi:hypothetical protein [macacine gammaherpesvirus 13]|uniref:Uncharacterized protein n=1 Tax=macacine gammaherpesvirus 13 TaxID=2341050 RepID=A0A3G1T4D6_9GAMA|nr:hypothetical protein QKT43_gp27 [Macaca arctoides gammaherpesvirus 1]AYA49812.1 hypothetical protein [Macaca arctoides gammaherpesvirus 1]